MTIASYYIYLITLCHLFLFIYYTLRLNVTFVNYFTFVNNLPTFKNTIQLRSMLDNISV